MSVNVTVILQRGIKLYTKIFVSFSKLNVEVFPDTISQESVVYLGWTF